MQVGVITVDGREIGVINFSIGRPDLAEQSAMLSGVESPDAEAPIGRDGPSGPAAPAASEKLHHRYHTPYSAPTHRGPVSVGPGDDPRGLEGHIREAAKAHKIDPDTAVAVAKSEGLRDFSGDRGTSFGAFQLHKGGGLGDEFEKQTGLDPSDPANEKATIDWAMKNASRTGWGPYHGAKRVGISEREGIDGTPSHVTAPTALEPSSDLRGGDVKGFIVHHTGGRGTVEGVQNTLNERRLGVEYIMDREGNITEAGGRGASHMMTGWGKGEGLSNRNTVGMEVIAKDDKDVTPAQVAAAKAFIQKNYPTTPVYGHGEVNPGHKEADEGMSIVNAIRGERAKAEKSAND